MVLTDCNDYDSVLLSDEGNMRKGLVPVLNTIVSLGRALFRSQGNDSDSKLSAVTALLKHSRVPAATHQFHALSITE